MSSAVTGRRGQAGRLPCLPPYIKTPAAMEQFIDEYVVEANKEVERFNRELELQGQPDLFDP